MPESSGNGVRLVHTFRAVTFDTIALEVHLHWADAFFYKMDRDSHRTHAAWNELTKLKLWIKRDPSLFYFMTVAWLAVRVADRGADRPTYSSYQRRRSEFLREGLGGISDLPATFGVSTSEREHEGSQNLHEYLERCQNVLLHIEMELHKADTRPPVDQRGLQHLRWAHLVAGQLQRDFDEHRATARPQPDARSQAPAGIAIEVAAYIGAAALGGIIANRADAIFVGQIQRAKELFARVCDRWSDASRDSAEPLSRSDAVDAAKAAALCLGIAEDSQEPMVTGATQIQDGKWVVQLVMNGERLRCSIPPGDPGRATILIVPGGDVPEQD